MGMDRLTKLRQTAKSMEASPEHWERKEELDLQASRMEHELCWFEAQRQKVMSFVTGFESRRQADGILNKSRLTDPTRKLQVLVAGCVQAGLISEEQAASVQKMCPARSELPCYRRRRWRSHSRLNQL